MTVDSEQLEEVVVLGYTSQKKNELSSSVVTINAEKLKDVTSPDLGNMLQGKAAGVLVTNASGQPGDGAKIRIRGTGSITANSGPLYVVDGAISSTKSESRHKLENTRYISSMRCTCFRKLPSTHS